MSSDQSQVVNQAHPPITSYGSACKDARPRRYEDRDGTRLNLAAIVEQFGIKPWTFEWHQENGWPALGGESLPAFRNRAEFLGLEERTWVEAQVSEVVKWTPYESAMRADTEGWIDEYTWRAANGTLFNTLTGVASLFPGLALTSVKRYAKHPCRYLKDSNGERRRLECLNIEPPIPRCVGKIAVYRQSDLQELHGALSAKPAMRRLSRAKKGQRWAGEIVHRDDDGKAWLTDSQAQARHGVKDNYCYKWSHRASILRNGQTALRSKRIPNPLRYARGSPGDVTVFREDDLLLILAGKETKRQGTGTGFAANALRDAARLKAKTALKAILGGARMRPSDIFAQAKAVHGLSERYMRWAANALGVLHEEARRPGRGGTSHYWSLPLALREAAVPPPAFVAPSELRDSARPAEPVAAESEPKRKRGRPRDHFIDAVYKFCYEHRKVKSVLCMQLANAKFGAGTITDDGFPRRWAKRYANRHGLSMD